MKIFFNKFVWKPNITKYKNEKEQYICYHRRFIRIVHLFGNLWYLDYKFKCKYGCFREEYSYDWYK